VTVGLKTSGIPGIIPKNERGRLKTIWATFYFYAFWGLLLVLLDNPPNGQWSKSGEVISISPSSLF
jgi:hypothetical protein